MAFYLCKAGGLLNGAQPWSMRMVMSSSSNESAMQASWDTAIQAWWNQAALTLYIPALTTLTYTQSSTASAVFKQTTITKNTHNIAGTSASKSLPYHVAEVFTLRTALATRYGRGRVYFPPLATNAADTTNGYIILPAAVTALAAGIAAFVTSLAGAATPQILHRHATLDGLRAANTVDPVVSYDQPNLFYTQRRRGSKVVPTRTAG